MMPPHHPSHISSLSYSQLPSPQTHLPTSSNSTASNKELEGYCSEDSFDADEGGSVGTENEEVELSSEDDCREFFKNSESYDDVGWSIISDPNTDERPFQKFPEFKNSEATLDSEVAKTVLTPLNALQLFLPDSLVEKMVGWTNDRAELFFASHPDLKGKLLGQRWHPITSSDMWTFILLSLQMSVVRLPSVLDYWRQSPTRSGPKIFSAKVMGRNR